MHHPAVGKECSAPSAGPGRALAIGTIGPARDGRTTVQAKRELVGAAATKHFAQIGDAISVNQGRAMITAGKLVGAMDADNAVPRRSPLEGRPVAPQTLGHFPRARKTVSQAVIPPLTAAVFENDRALAAHFQTRDAFLAPALTGCGRPDLDVLCQTERATHEDRFAPCQPRPPALSPRLHFGTFSDRAGIVWTIIQTQPGERRT